MKAIGFQVGKARRHLAGVVLAILVQTWILASNGLSGYLIYIENPKSLSLQIICWIVLVYGIIRVLPDAVISLRGIDMIFDERSADIDHITLPRSEVFVERHNDLFGEFFQLFAGDRSRRIPTRFLTDESRQDLDGFSEQARNI